MSNNKQEGTHKHCCPEGEFLYYYNKFNNKTMKENKQEGTHVAVPVDDTEKIVGDIVALSKEALKQTE